MKIDCKLTPEQRKERARNAARARWERTPKEERKSPLASPESLLKSLRTRARNAGYMVISLDSYEDLKSRGLL